jgi:hypothetical protein
MTDSELEDRLFKYLWLALNTINPHAGRVAQLIQEAERRGKPEMVERTRMKAVATPVAKAERGLDVLTVAPSHLQLKRRPLLNSRGPLRRLRLLTRSEPPAVLPPAGYALKVALTSTSTKAGFQVQPITSPFYTEVGAMLIMYNDWGLSPLKKGSDMAVLNIFSPGKLTVGGSGGNFQTQFVSNPWGVSGVWIQCTTKYVAGDGQSDFGIQEIDFLDDQGSFQKQVFGDANSPYGSLLARKYVDNLLGVTVAANTFDAVIEGTLTLFQWG